jgi:hypothetical protein
LQAEGSDELIKITHGFTLHCDVKLSNNLEVNWGGNKWHINPKGDFLPQALPYCTDNPAVEPDPPPAPFDNIAACAMGRWNGEPDHKACFQLEDAGEPGGKSDKAGLTIFDLNGTTVLLHAEFDVIESGNIQAHYDQPHGSNWNK